MYIILSPRRISSADVHSFCSFLRCGLHVHQVISLVHTAKVAFWLYLRAFLLVQLDRGADRRQAMKG